MHLFSHNMALQTASVLDLPLFRCKWSVPLMVALSLRPHRFSELEKTLGVSSKVLSRKLTSLSSMGYVEFREGRYYLTRLGAMLAERLKTVATSTVEAAVVAEVLKCKWPKELLTILLNGPMHSVELVKSVSGLSWKVASERLRKLERMGLVSRRYLFGRVPVRVVYSLTARGRLVAGWLLLQAGEKIKGTQIVHQPT
jgi:DNA-binding HxlR family transcriptional regulator